jgi:hypothetical protein
METALAVKNVDFYGDNLLAIQENTTKVIYVAINYVLRGVGFNDKQIEYQRDKMVSDKVIAKGTQKFSGTLLKASTGKDMWCISLFKLPLALAKISITPKMQKETPQLANKLEMYQDECADVLAKAFLPQYQKSNDIPNEYKDYIDQRVQQCVTSYIEPLHKEFQHGLNSIHNAFIGVQKALPAINKVLPTNITNSDSNGVESVVDETVLWKRKIYAQADNIVKNSPTLTKNPQVLHSVYTVMRNQYGIVFEQEKREYKEKYGIEHNVSTIDIVADNQKLKSLFESILSDMESNDNTTEQHKQIVNTIIDPIASTINPLIAKRNDKTKGGNKTYRKVYAAMGVVSWEMRRKRYQHVHKLKNIPSKRVLIRNDPKLLKSFCSTVNKMLAE